MKIVFSLFKGLLLYCRCYRFVLDGRNQCEELTMKASLASTLRNNAPITKMDSLPNSFLLRLATFVRGLRTTDLSLANDDGNDAREESKTAFPDAPQSDSSSLPSSTTGKFSNLEEIEKILSMSPKIVNPKQLRDAMEAEYEFFKYSGNWHGESATRTD